MKNLSLEQLENDFWGEPEFNSYVVQTAHNARKKPLSQLSNEEIRLLIGQKISLKHLLPIAVEKLEENIMLEASLYEGDLLENVLSLDKMDWNDNQSELERLTELVMNNKEQLLSGDEISNTIVEKFIGYKK